jgi:hypothetical protein
MGFHFTIDEGGDQKQRNRETEVHHRRSLDGEGDATEIASGWLHPPPASSTSLSTIPLHHHHCNLLANMIFDLIYYIHVIYCIAMSSFE